MKKEVIMVGGCAGMIGSNFCSWLLDNTDYDVVGIDNLSGGFYENMPVSSRFIFIKHDLAEISSYLDNIFYLHKPKVFYAFNAYAAEGRSNYIRTFIHYNNTVSICNIINACVNHDCKLIFTSSVAVYSGEPPFNEETEPNPIDEYGLSKLTSERSIKIAGEVSGLDWCIVRPRNVYGERQSLLDPARNLFGIFCYNALKGLPLTIFGDGRNERAFTYIGDIMKPLYLAMNVSKEIINLGSEWHSTLNQAAEVFAKVTGYDNIVHIEARHEVPVAYCEVEKSKRLIGFMDETTLSIGLKRMWDWAKTKQVGERQTPPKLEILKTNHSSIV